MLQQVLVDSTGLGRRARYLAWRLILQAPRITAPERYEQELWRSTIPNQELPWTNEAWWTKPWTCFGTFETFSSITAYLTQAVKDTDTPLPQKARSPKAENDNNKNHACHKSVAWNKCVMERNSLFHFPRAPRSSGLFFALLFSFLRAKKVVGWKEWAAGRPCSSLTLKHAVPEAAAAFQRGNILAALLSLWLPPLMPHSRFHSIWLFLLCFEKLPRNKRKTRLEYSVTYSFISTSILIQSYLPKKESAFTTGKTLFSWNCLFFLGRGKYWQIMRPFLMKISCFSPNNKPFPVSIVIV